MLNGDYSRKIPLENLGEKVEKSLHYEVQTSNLWRSTGVRAHVRFVPERPRKAVDFVALLGY